MSTANHGGDDVPDSDNWAPAELVRAIRALTEEVKKLPAEWRGEIEKLRTELRDDYVRKDVYDARAVANDQWRNDIGREVVDLGASVERAHRAIAEAKDGAALALSQHMREAAENANDYVTKDEVTKARNYVLAALGVAVAVLGVIGPFVLFALDRLVAK